MKKYIKVTVLIVPLLFIKVQLYSQCGFSSLISHFPVTVNNITITETDTDGPPYQYGGATVDTISNCGVLSSTHLLLGFTTTSPAYDPFIQTLTFSSPVNNIVYIIVGSDSIQFDSTTLIVESFSFAVNAGTLNCTQQGTCLFTQHNNVFSSNTNGYIVHGKDNNAYITLSSTIPYTSITISGSGGNGGSYISLCANSINATGIKDIKDNKQTLLSLYPNPTNGKLNISNFNADQKNTYIEITDITGKLISSQQSPINSGIVELNLNIDNGIYFVKAINEKGEIQVQKIIINK